MDRKEELKAWIEQNLADRAKLADEGDRLQEELAKLRTTYSIGDRFKVTHGNDGSVHKTILANICGKIAMVGLDGGGFYFYGKKCNYINYKISSEQFESWCGADKFTRYWDCRRKIKT